MRAKLVTLFALVPALVAASVSPAGATAPTVTQVVVNRTFTLPAGTACSFPLAIHNEGIRRTTTFVGAARTSTRALVPSVSATDNVRRRPATSSNQSRRRTR